MTTRSWRWLLVRIQGLLTRPPAYDMSGRPRFTTRIQVDLWQPATAPDQQRQREAE